MKIERKVTVGLLEYTLVRVMRIGNRECHHSYEKQGLTKRMAVIVMIS
jgi:hypothetical protein